MGAAPHGRSAFAPRSGGLARANARKPIFQGADGPPSPMAADNCTSCPTACHPRSRSTGSGSRYCSSRSPSRQPPCAKGSPHHQAGADLTDAVAVQRGLAGSAACPARDTRLRTDAHFPAWVQMRACSASRYGRTARRRSHAAHWILPDLTPRHGRARMGAPDSPLRPVAAKGPPCAARSTPSSPISADPAAGLSPSTQSALAMSCGRGF